MVKWIQKKAKIKADREDDLKTKILKARGIPLEDHQEFLFPDEKWENPPFEIRNVERAVNRILEGIADKETIVVSGDPDADGITATAIMFNRLKALQDFNEFNLDYIYPQRDTGHGLYGQLSVQDHWLNKAEKAKAEKDKESLAKWEKLIDLSRSNIEKTKAADILIVLDSSSNDLEGIERARTLNPDLDIIILDHHEFDSKEIANKMDKEVILCNPHHHLDKSVNKDLSGAGMAYKVAKGIDDVLGDEGFSNQFRDLVAIGLVGDMMSVLNFENRYLISQGLQNVNNVGLSRILKGAKINTYRYNTKDIGYSVAPLINSSARMGEIELAFQIFMLDNDTDAEKLRLKMDKLNKKRQETQKAVMQKYEDTQDMEDKIVIVIDSESNKGMNGLVAQNIAQKYHRPCFVVTEGKDGVCRGSGRSYGSFNTNEFLSELDFVEAQGHGQAHGLNFPLDRLDDLKEYIEENMPDNLEAEQTFYYDIELENVEEAFMALTDLININYITGNDFPEVVVRMDNVMIEERAVIGKTKETVKFKTSGDLAFIKFKVNEDWNKDIDTFDTVSVVGNGTINEFYNFWTKEMTRTPQIIIMDIVKD